MPTLAVEMDARVADVAVTASHLEVSLRDGRRISAPIAWFPRLAAAEPDAQRTWEPAAAGMGIHWPLIDEDLSVEGLLRGKSA